MRPKSNSAVLHDSPEWWLIGSAERLEDAVAGFLSDSARKQSRALPGSPRPGEAPEDLYAVTWERLEQRLPELVEQARERRQAVEGLLAELMSAPPGRRLGAVLEPRFRSLALLDFLVAESCASQLSAPGRAAELARLAAQLATAFGEGEEEAVAALPRAFCLGANARRLDGRPKAAEALLAKAVPCLTGRQDRACYCRVLALLRWEQGRIDEADALLQHAAVLFAADGLDREVGACLLVLGLILLEEGGEGDALFLLARGWDKMDREGHPLLALRGGLVLAAALAEDNQPQRARGVLREAWQLFSQVHDPAEMVRVYWLEGRALARLGERDEALHILESVRRELASEPSPAETALESLDLALALAESGRAGEIEAVGEGLRSWFPGVAALGFAARRVRLLARLAERDDPLLRQAVYATRITLRRKFRVCGFHVRPLPFG
jgi:tetratricopeptide (TPR) repeat protein